MGLILDFLPTIVGLIMGALTSHWKQKSQDLHAERMWALKATESARNYQTKGSSWSRKFIVQSVIGSLFLFPMLLTVMNYVGAMLSPQYLPIAVYVPRELVQGGLFSLLWNEKSIEYLPIYGFVFMPIHFFMAQIIGGFYYGSSSPRK